MVINNYETENVLSNLVYITNGKILICGRTKSSCEGVKDVVIQLRTSDQEPEVNGLCFQFVLYTSLLQLTVVLSVT